MSKPARNPGRYPSGPSTELLQGGAARRSAPQPKAAGPRTQPAAQGIARTTPAAPPVYRPQTAAAAAQPKTAHGAPPNRKSPAAPPAYQPTTKVLQAKPATAQAPKSPEPPTAPPAYRREAQQAVQPKAGSPRRNSPAAPPAARPQGQRVAQPQTPPPAQARTPPKAPTATRPVQMKAQTAAPPVSHPQRRKAEAPRTGARAAASASIQLKRASDVVQMTPCGRHRMENCQLCGLLGLVSGTDGHSTITRNIYSYLSNQDVGQLALTSRGVSGYANVESDRRHRIAVYQRVKEPFHKGVFSGTYERGDGQNWADLHVTGQTGGSMSTSDLIDILSYLYEKMRVCHRETGVAGVLEWHPTGAVVTKSVIELLAMALGGMLSVSKGLIYQQKRKYFEKGKNRDKFASRLDADLLPEYFAFLSSLKGVPGLTIVGVVRTKPSYVRSLKSVEEQAQAIEQNMLDESSYGNAWYSQYEEEYRSGVGEGPSIRVRIGYHLIPKLIKALRKKK